MAADRSTISALCEALEDEYRARATYREVIRAFGPARPFVNIVEAEERHVTALLTLFARLGIAPPADTWPARVKAPPSLRDACREGVKAEIENDAMYDRLLRQTEDPEARQVMQQLQRASRERHLPAGGQPGRNGHRATTADARLFRCAGRRAGAGRLSFGGERADRRPQRSAEHLAVAQARERTRRHLQAGHRAQLTANPYAVKGPKKYEFGVGEDNGWITHAGTVPGYNSDFGYLPKLGASIVVLTNTDIEAEPRSQPAVSVMSALSAVIAPEDVSSP